MGRESSLELEPQGSSAPWDGNAGGADPPQLWGAAQSSLSGTLRGTVLGREDRKVPLVLGLLRQLRKPRNWRCVGVSRGAEWGAVS